VSEPVRRAAVITHGRRETIGPALDRVQAVARETGVELLLPEDELAKHALDDDGADVSEADIAVVLGGDGTMLRALRRFLGTNIPALGVNFGSIGFLTSVAETDLEGGLRRVFEGEYKVVELPTLETRSLDDRHEAVNDVVATSSTLGRMVRLSWSVGGEDLGTLHCDGIVCATPSGSTAYNLSNGGPVLVWGLDAMAVTFAAPHSLHARPTVVPRGRDLVVRNETPDVWVTALADGHVFSEVPPGGELLVRLGPQRSMLATRPDVTFFSRYRQAFAS
jgi:NAD+ kinase